MFNNYIISFITLILIFLTKLNANIFEEVANEFIRTGKKEQLILKEIKAWRQKYRYLDPESEEENVRVGEEFREWLNGLGYIRKPKFAYLSTTFFNKIADEYKTKDRNAEITQEIKTWSQKYRYLDPESEEENVIVGEEFREWLNGLGYIRKRKNVRFDDKTNIFIPKDYTDLSKEIIRAFKIDSKKDLWGTEITLYLEPDQGEFYKLLQKDISSYIPEESKRPTIHVIVSKSFDDLNQKPSIGILGGTGPISDSLLLDEVLHQLKKNPINWDNFYIKLLSMPTPRTKIEIVKFGASYSNIARKFMNESHSNFFLSSNTAHLNLDKVKKMALNHADRVVDLSQYVAQRALDIVSKNKKKKEVLVLGTYQAWKANLYPPILKQMNMDAQSIILDKSDAKELQRLVDETKSGRPEEAKDGMDDIIKRYVQQADIDKDDRLAIILGCTEIPATIKESDQEIIKKEFKRKNKKIAFVDSEIVFAETIAVYINNIAERRRASVTSLGHALKLFIKNIKKKP